MRPRSLRRVADILTLAVVGAILVGTLSPPGSPTDTTFGLNPNLGHLALFGALGVSSALRFAVSGRARRFPRSTLGMVFFGFWLLAAGTEFLQGFVGRDPSFSDWVIDMVSAIAGFLGGSAALRLVFDRGAVLPAPVPAPPRVRPSRRRARRRARLR
jgi:VanZ family protein